MELDKKNVDLGRKLQNREVTIDFHEIIFILLRSWKLIGGIASIVVVFATLYAFIKSPVYRAESLIQITPQGQEGVNLESLMMGGVNDSLTIKSEVDILQSRKIAKRVIEKLDLAKHIKNHADKYTSRLVDLEDIVAYEGLIEGILSNTKIISNPTSYSVRVQYYHENPKFAADVANALVSEYLGEQLEVKFDSVRRVNEWLNVRVESLKNKLKESERVVQLFKENNDIVESLRGSVDEQKMTDLNTQLIIASSERAQAEAKLESALKLNSKEGDDSSNEDDESSRGGIFSDSSFEVLSSPIIQRLKQEETEVMRKRADLGNRYGPKHPNMININAELQDVRNKMKSEVYNIINSLRSDVTIAKAKESNLKQQINKLKGKLNVNNKVYIQLAELEREAEANRALYESFLSRFKELSESQDYAQPVARVISEAETPIYPAYPRKKLIIFIAIIFGGMLGCGTVLALQFFDFGIKNVHDLEKITTLPIIGVLPKISYDGKLSDYCVEKQKSHYAESLRSILTFLHTYRKDKGSEPRTVLVTSSMTQEGKTLTSVSLARLKALSGKKVLLIDADMRLSYVADLFNEKVKYGLQDYLTGKVSIDKVVHTDEKTGLDFIASHESTINSQELLSSNQMLRLLSKVYDEYDLIIIDSPPVVAISDALRLSHVVDATLCLVRADETKKRLFNMALRQFELNNIVPVGVIMTFADLSRGNGYYYGGYYNYYSSQKSKYYES